MKFSDQWLREWVNPPLGPEELGARLTMAGLELDGIEPAAPPFTGVVVGRVLSAEPHPDADKLRVCRVEDGEGEPKQVVCGAPNVHAGMLAPFARVGAELPGGLKIKRAKLRGVESLGMLCSAKELGLAETSEGLLALPADASVGQDIRAHLGLDDQILEVDLTPNRADCLSIAGIARETAALTGAALTVVSTAPVAAVTEDRLTVEVEAPAACPRYAGRIIRGIDPGARTPLWLQERLRRCGIRSLGPVVDVTNYVLIELGQPMHAFDLARLEGGLRVRMAAAGERLRLLDGQDVELKPDSLVIADQAGPLAIAGVMGGADSAVGEGTVDIFLESAHFSPDAIAGRARGYGLHTESSHRFERGVDPALQVAAIERATRLLLDIVGGRPGPVVDVVSPDHLPRPPVIVLRAGRIARLLEIELPAPEVERMLARLGCAVEAVELGWRVVPPSYRFDLRIEADLIEEVARIHGYDNIPSTTRAFRPAIAARPEARLPLARVRSLLVDRGYREVVTYSFVAPELETLVSPDAVPMRLANPISADLAVMRTTLWPGLIQTAQRNLNRQQRQVRIFESGLAFDTRGGELRQIPRLAGLACGPVLPEQWGSRERPIDFFDMKGDVEAILNLPGLAERVSFEAAPHPALHPGQSAAIRLDGRPIGWLGMLHPGLERTLDLHAKVFLFDLDLAAIRQGTVAKFSEISKFPAIRRDLALVVDEAVTAHQVLASLRSLRLAELRDFVLFDVYTGEGVPSGRKSLALGLILQDLSRTLTDQEVEQSIRRVVEQLARDVGATLRI